MILVSKCSILCMCVIIYKGIYSKTGIILKLNEPLIAIRIYKFSCVIFHEITLCFLTLFF